MAGNSRRREQQAYYRDHSLAWLEPGECRSEVQEELQIMDFLFPILLIFMHVTDSPKDARAGISPTLQSHRPALGAAFLPSSPFMIVAAHHPLENKCLFVLWPHASPAFCPWPPALLPVLSLPEGCRLPHVQLQGASCTQTPPSPPPARVPQHPGTVQCFYDELEGARPCLFCPLTKIASPRVSENKTKHTKALYP